MQDYAPQKNKTTPLESYSECWSWKHTALELKEAYTELKGTKGVHFEGFRMFRSHFDCTSPGLVSTILFILSQSYEGLLETMRSRHTNYSEILRTSTTLGLELLHETNS